MPLHEYLCKKCGEKIELIQKFSDAPLTKCTSCGGRLERLFFAPAIKFKGSGWYITDYAKGNGKETSSDVSAKESGSTAKAKKKGDPPKAKKPSGAEKSSAAK